MDRLIYTALSGMRASMDQQRVLASNMANARTPGFRAELLQRQSVTLEGDALEVRALQSAAVTGARMEAGELVETGRPLDIAVEGAALIAVQSPDGSEAYTARGDLSLSPAGLLLTGDGYPVMGEGGPLSVPPGAKPAIAPDGTVTASDPANPAAPPQEIGRIKLAGWQGSPIAKGLDGLFRVNGGGILPADEAARVKPGFIEQSNVKSTEVLVEMIDAQRLFEMRSKLVSTAKELDERGAGLMRLT